MYCLFLISQWTVPFGIRSDWAALRSPTPKRRKKEISGGRKWACRKHTYKLLPFWDFAEVIKTSDKSLGAEPNTIKASFPSLHVCLFICRRSTLSIRPFCPTDHQSVHFQGLMLISLTCWFAVEWRTSDYTENDRRWSWGGGGDEVP